MSVSVLGAVLGATWMGLGAAFVWFLLNKTKGLENTKFFYGLTASEMRQKFGYFALASVLAGAAVGWVGGPTIVPIILGES
jgi:hypothetical protein